MALKISAGGNTMSKEVVKVCANNWITTVIYKNWHYLIVLGFSL